MADSAGRVDVNTSADIAYKMLDKYLKPKNPKGIFRHIAKRPLLRILEEKQEMFKATKEYIRQPVKGVLMSATSGALHGWSGDDTLTFTAADYVTEAKFPTRNIHMGFKVNQDELQRGGVHVINGNIVTDEDSDVKIVGVLSEKLADFGESYAIQKNRMFWAEDCSSDTDAVPGILTLITDDPTTGTMGGLSRADNTWWRHIAKVGNDAIAYSREDGTLTQALRYNIRQLSQYGGMPDVLLAGMDFIDMCERELSKMGQITVTGWADKATNIEIKGIRLGSLGVIEWDPTLDSLGYSKRLYVWDSSHLKLRPQMHEQDKITNHESPYDQFVFLKSVTWTGALTLDQPDCCGVFEAK